MALMPKTTELSLKTTRRTQFLPITARLVDVLVANDWINGVLTVFVPHTTAAITINENADPDVARDMEWFVVNWCLTTGTSSMGKETPTRISRQVSSGHQCRLSSVMEN